VGLIPALEVLGYVYAYALHGRFEEGLRHYRRAKKICPRELGTNHAGGARQHEHEGLVHFCAGDFTDTERCFREAHDTLLRTGLDCFSPEIMP
jgi:tetratricopeptide (TPR) repeat protein